MKVLLLISCFCLISCSEKTYEDGVRAYKERKWRLSKSIMESVVNRTGAANAKTELARMYLQGIGVKPDKKKQNHYS